MADLTSSQQDATTVRQMMVGEARLSWQFAHFLFVTFIIIMSKFENIFQSSIMSKCDYHHE